MNQPIFTIEHLDKSPEQVKIPGYFIASTAPINIEGESSRSSELNPANKRTSVDLDELVELIFRLGTKEDKSQSESKPVQLIISTHGFNTNEQQVRGLFNKIHDFINKDPEIEGRDNLVYLGYRWPSESALTNIKNAFAALPRLATWIFTVGLIGLIATFLSLNLTQLGQIFFSNSWSAIILNLLLISNLLFALITTLILLRLSVYFRDKYRATNFGVPDLVEFIRQLDRGLVEKAKEEQLVWNEDNKIRLSFLANSMGCDVITNVIRILSDVFDPRSIGQLDTNKTPSENIGNVFTLERLVLVAPDLPVNAILSGRANFLRSSLRRFKEAYLFSNEADLALRIASTIANYFSFPSSHRNTGHRLGNIGIKNESGYGILNLESIVREQPQTPRELLANFFVDCTNPQITLATIQAEYQNYEGEEKEKIVNLFTFFDCTEYTQLNRRFLSRQKSGFQPMWYYYIMLTLDSILGKLDTHGGYFLGRWTQELIYRLAFANFQGLMHSLDDGEFSTGLQELHQNCQKYQIQVVLSPERYEVDMKDNDRAKIREQLLNQ